MPSIGPASTTALLTPDRTVPLPGQAPGGMRSTGNLSARSQCAPLILAPAAAPPAPTPADRRRMAPCPHCPLRAGRACNRGRRLTIRGRAIAFLHGASAAASARARATSARRPCNTGQGGPANRPRASCPPLHSACPPTLCTQLAVAPARQARIQASLVTGDGSMANEYWLSEAAWSAIEPLIPMHRRWLSRIPDQSWQHAGDPAEPDTQESATLRRGTLQGPQRDRAGLLAPQRLAPRGHTLRQTCQELPCRRPPGGQPHLVDVSESRA
jgi:hypothetical protein